MGTAPAKAALARYSLRRELLDYLTEKFGDRGEINRIAHSLGRADLNQNSYYPFEFKETINAIRRDYSRGNTIVSSAWILSVTEAGLISYLISGTKDRI